MSLIEAKVIEIQNEQNLHLVKFDFEGIILTMVALELNEKIQINTRILLSVKSTHTALAKDINAKLSFCNTIPALVKSVENGKILSSIILEVKNKIFESVITKESSLNMKIQKNDEVYILLKANELSILEVLDD